MGNATRVVKVKRLAQAFAPIALAAVTWAVPVATHAQASPPSIRHRNVQAACDVGSLMLRATQGQLVPGGASVRVVDTVDEQGTVRVLSDTTVQVHIGVAATAEIDHPIVFRSSTGRAAFTFVRTTEIRIAPGGSKPPDDVDILTVVCAGVGPATTSPSSTAITASSGSSALGSTGGPSSSAAQRPVVAVPRFTG